MSDDRFFIGQAGGFDTSLGPQPECFSARRIVTIVEQGIQPEDRLHMSECDPCSRSLVRYLESQRKFAVYVAEPPECTVAGATLSVEMFGAPELVIALDTHSLRLGGGLTAGRPRLRNREATLLELTFEQAFVPKEVQRELANYVELVKPVTITGMLRGGGELQSKGEVIFRNQAAAAR